MKTHTHSWVIDRRRKVQVFERRRRKRIRRLWRKAWKELWKSFQENEMARKRSPCCTMTNLLHVTREDGRVTEVSKELVMEGPMQIFIGDPLDPSRGFRFVGTTHELRLDNPIYKDQSHGNQR